MSTTSDLSSPTTKLSLPPKTELSVAKNFYFGEILEENLFPYPPLRSNDREVLGQIVDAIDDFLAPQHEALRGYDRSGHQPTEFVQALRDMGLFGLIIPEEYGGLGLSNGAYARVLAQSSSHDVSTTLTIGAHSSIGMKGLLLFGNDEQKARYLPRLASGELIAAFCLTESGAGSDAAALKTSAKRNADGSWTLNGEKIWITNGGIAGFYTVFARTDSTGGKLSAFIVDGDSAGVSRGAHEDKMGIRASSTTTVAFADVQVPAANLLGEEGKGFKIAMAILNNGRTGLGGGAVGGIKALIRMATQQAKERKQFGRSIAEFGLIRKKLAQMAVECFAAESAVWMVAHYIDAGFDDCSIEAAISKVYASEAVQRAAHEALQIAAGNGYMRDYSYEQITRDTRILSIFEGTNEILRLYVALSGLKDLGGSLAELKHAVGSIFNHPIKGFGVLSGYAGRRIRQTTGVGIDRIVKTLTPELREAAEIYERSVVELANTSDQVLKKYGKRIADEQYALERLGNIAIDLFVGLCALSRAAALKDADAADAAHASQLAVVFARQARRRIVGNLKALDHNDDDRIEAIAARTIELEAYPFDVL